MSDITLTDIENAARALEGHVLKTPMVPAGNIQRDYQANIWLKLENLQYTNAFKVRGALNKILQLTDAEQESGVIACSAGNHAQGVAFHTQTHGIKTTIVMPKNTPFSKIQATENLGAEIHLEGESLAEAMEYARTYGKKNNLTFIHPYDDAHVIAGQGTIGLEILEQCPQLDTLIVPIGGGGLMAGIATAIKAKQPDIEIIGVQSERFAAMKHKIEGGSAPSFDTTIAEGIAVKHPSDLTHKIIAKHVSRIETVSEKSIEKAVYSLLAREKIIAEGAAGAALAIVFEKPDDFAGKNVGIVICGGNIDPRLLSNIILRGLARDGKLCRLRIKISDSPGFLGKVSTLIGNTGANIIEVHHQRMVNDIPIKEAELDIVVETRDKNHVKTVLSTLLDAGYATELMNEIG